MKPFPTYLKANFRKSYWGCVWISFFGMLLLLFVIVIGFVVLEFTTKEVASFQLIDVVILIGLFVAVIPILFFASLVNAAVFAALYLWSRWLQHRHDETFDSLDSNDDSARL